MSLVELREELHALPKTLFLELAPEEFDRAADDYRQVPSACPVWSGAFLFQGTWIVRRA